MIPIEVNWEFRLLLCVLTCYRLAKMIAEDDGPGFIFKRVRYWAKDKAWLEAQKASHLINGLSDLEIDDRHFGKWHNLAEGLSCPYCAGVWISIPLFFMWLYPFTLGDLFLILITISGGQAFLQSLKK